MISSATTTTAALLLLAATVTAFAPPLYTRSSTAAAAPSLLRASFAPDYFRDYDDENDLHIPNRLGFTTSGWTSMSDAQEVFDMLQDAGINLVTTSFNKCDMLGQAMRESPEAAKAAIVVCTVSGTFLTLGEAAVLDQMEAMTEKMGIPELEVCAVKPALLSSTGSLATGMREAIDEGFCVSGGAVGLSAGKMNKMCRKMEQRDELLMTNEFPFSLVQRKNEKLIERCKQNDVIPLIRHPLGKDLLASGTWTSADPSGNGAGKKFSIKVLEKYEPLHSVMYSIAEKAKGRAGRESRELKDYRARRYEEDVSKNRLGVTPAMVAIHYVVAKGGVPLVEVNNEASAQELLGCLGWRLQDDEVRMLDQAAELCEM